MWCPRDPRAGRPGVTGRLPCRPGHEDVVTEQELVLDVPAGGVGREIDEQRAHWRQARFGGLPHLGHHVGAQAFAQEEQLADDAVLLVAERPDLIVRAGLLRPDHRARLADPVQPEDRAEHAELEPADDQLAERGVVDIAVLEPPDVRRPPRDAGQADVQASGNLPAQVLEGRVDVTGPDQGTVALAARPRGPAQADNLVLAFRPHAVVEALGVQHRVEVADLGPGAEVVAEVLRLLRPELRLAGVEPPGPDAVLEVVLPDLGPDVGAGLGVGRVVEGHQRAPGRAPVPDGQLDADAPLVVDQQAKLFHLRVVLAVRVDRGPDRDHQLHAEPVQFSDHRPGVGPFLRVELPVALTGPVEVVGDDDRKRQPAPLVLAGRC